MKMKKKWFAVLLVMLTAMLTMAESERGIWLRPPDNLDDVPEMVELIASGNFNTIYLETFYHGYSVAPNPYIPQRECYQEEGVFGKKDIDVLQMFIDESKKHNISVHAWLEVFYWGVDPEMLDDFPVTKLFDKNPEWKALLRSGKVTSHSEFAHIFTNPAYKEVRDLMHNYIRYLAENYDIGAVQLDYIRYSAHDQDGGYDPLTRELFQKVSGYDPMLLKMDVKDPVWQLWVEFRENIVTEFVGGVRKVIDEVNEKEEKDIQITCAVFGKYYDLRYKDHHYQDWKTWTDRGYIDTLYPMAYSVEVGGMMKEVNRVRDLIRNPRVKLAAGIASPKKKKDRYGGPGFPLLPLQIAELKKHRIESYAVFCYRWLKSSDPEFDTLK